MTSSEQEKNSNGDDVKLSWMDVLAYIIAAFSIILPFAFSVIAALILVLFVVKLFV